MKAIRFLVLAIVGATISLAALPCFAQVVINEVVDDNRNADSTGGDPDTREFIELYNAGTSAVNIGGWTLNYWQLGSATILGSYFATFDEIPANTMLGAGDYYVLGHDGVPNVDQPLGANLNLFPDQNTVFELRNGPQASGILVDAVAIETFRGVELTNLRPEHSAQVGGGFWGQSLSMDAVGPNLPQSLGRYLNGRDTNVNGRDFGMLPITPGTSNNLPQNAAHSVPDVTGMTTGTTLSTNYYASFVLPRVIDPNSVGPAGADGNNINTKAITPSPQGGNAIIAYDETGGGNAAYSKEYVNEFALYAYIDTADLNLNQATAQHEASTYGIGTTDAFFGTPNQAGLNTLTSTQNGNTGIGWMIQRAEAVGGGETTTLLQLIDFNDGGDSVQADNDWQIKQTIDLSGAAPGWHALSVDYDPATGAVAAKHNNETFNFTTATGLVGNFYVGYRENLPGTGNAVARPPTYDLFVAAPGGITGDYNNNGTVDAADYVVWRDNQNTNNTLPNNSLPGPIGQAHFDQWRANFGMGAGAVGQASGVPEPGAMVLAATSLAVAFGLRYRARGAQR